MLASLTIWFCALSAPDQCEPHFVGEMTMLQCQTGWQRAAAEWVGKHPELRFERYECLPGTDEA
jgi:hypothetical protein